ncbi:MAG: hypothetical protein ACI8XW_001739, partial [Gammaproteobacteria bacterium]
MKINRELILGLRVLVVLSWLEPSCSITAVVPFTGSIFRYLRRF